MKFDIGSIFYSLFFIGIGGYFAFFWPRAIRNKINEGLEASEMGNIVRWVRPTAMLLFLYCVVELAWHFYRHWK